MSDTENDPAVRGHEWDGIQEFDNPLPLWWKWVFYATIVWAVGYWIVMPAWPLIDSHTKGVIGYSSRASVIAEVAEARAAQQQFHDRIDAASLEEIRTDRELLQFALAGGRSAFAVNCSQCHGSGASGRIGYPNLNDDEWLWGGSLKAIQYTIVHGIRNETDDTRISDMPGFLRDEVLTAEQVDDVTEYVLLISRQEHDAAAAARGEAIYKEHCASCHAEGGRGNAEFGAPALNNDIWLYGGDREAIRSITANSRGGVMPAWGKLLDQNTIKQLAIYVHSLGGGQ